MRILIYGLNYAPELTGIGKYTGDMTEWLAAQGNDVRVITAPPYYPAWKISDGFSGWRYAKEDVDGVQVHRCPLYVPERPNTLTRLLHLATFALSSLPVLLSQISWRPDVVVCVVPTLFCAPQAIVFSKLAGAKSWLHIQDFELDAMLGLGMAKGAGLISRFATRLEREVISRFSRVSTISHSMLRHAQLKGVLPAASVYFPNWVETSFITPEADRDTFRRKWGYRSEDVVALYSGNLGKKQGLESVLHAAKALKHIKFVIVGEGAHGRLLMESAHDARLDNLRFFPLQPYEALPDLLRMADLHLVIQKRGAADAVLPSKLTSILASGGHAVITADQDTELGRLVKDTPGIATLVEPENVTALIGALRSLAEEKRGGGSAYNAVARRYAEEHLSREAVLSRFHAELLSVAGQQEGGVFARSK